MQQITGNVYAKTTFHGCNSGFIITGEGAVVIDTPMVPSEAKGWKQQIEKHAPIRYVIINEAHTDHYSGSCYLGGTLVGTEDSAKALSRAKVEDLVKELSWMAPGSPAPDEDFYFRRPDITINGEAKIYLGEHTFNILSVPGHTAKQLAVHVPEERVLFTSDNINLNIPIFIDSLPHEWLESLDRLSALDVDHVIPGHGDVKDKSAFIIMRDMITLWMDVIGRFVKEGVDEEGVKQRAAGAKEFAHIPKEGPMAGLFFMNVDALYRALLK